MEDNVNNEDVLKILIATDIHLGYGESDPIREKDTFVTFEEILKIGVDENVDFILLGGDLFHESKPSPNSTNRCIQLIKKYCLGDKPVEIQFLSDPSYNFSQNPNPIVNYEDPNLNVSIPIFSIHGNHDDPTGKHQVSALDLISSTGLVNYFGRWDHLDKVDIIPILLKKGETKLALYGLSHIRDERLARLFLDNKVHLTTTENPDDWFNLLVLHQNRAERGIKNFIADSFIPEFINLVIWGHEHDCRITPEAVGKTYISQPGSSVATSLAAGEAVPKCVGVLHVHKTDFRMEVFELHTVRPFIFDELYLTPPSDAAIEYKLSEYAQSEVTKKIDEMIIRAKQLNRKPDLLPLIRLVVKYENDNLTFNTIRFGQKYYEVVANPQDIIKFSSLKVKKRTKDGTAERVRRDDLDELTIDNLEDLVEKFLGDQKLNVLSINGLNRAIKKQIDSRDNEALSIIVDYQCNETLKKLEEMNPIESEVEWTLQKLRDAREGKENLDQINKILNDPNRKKPTSNIQDDNIIIDDDDDNDTNNFSIASTSAPPVKPTRGRGSRGGPGSRGGRGKRAK